MELFDILYRRGCDDHERFFEEFEGIDDAKDQLQVIHDLKKIICKDLERVYYSKIEGCHNNAELKGRIEKLLKTYDDDKFGKNNFLTLTDRYLCFNHYDSFAGYNPKSLEPIVPFTIPSCSTIQTIVIITRDFNHFYFIEENENVLTGKAISTVNSFSLEKNNIKSASICYDGKLIFERTDSAIDTFLKTQKVKEYKAS